MDVESLRLALATISLAGTVLWLALGGLCLHLWRRDRRRGYLRLAAGFLLLGLNRPLAGLLSPLLGTIYNAFATDFDPLGQEEALLAGMASSGLALIAVLLIGVGLAATARTSTADPPPAPPAPSRRRGRKGQSKP